MQPPERERPSSAGALHVLFAAAAFAVMTSAAKLLGTRLPVFEIVFVRALFSALVTAALLRRVRSPLLGTRRPLLALRGLFGFLGLSCSFYAVIHLPLAEATLLQFVHPIFTVALAALVLG
jgi:drug/metabolite transporter (DMT)-like permease